MWDLELRLKNLDAERSEVLKSIEELRLAAYRETKLPQVAEISILGRPLLNSIPVTPDEKIAVFLRLFRCRENVYPKRWENAKSGKNGYAPVCHNEWVQPTAVQNNLFPLIAPT